MHTHRSALYRRIQAVILAVTLAGLTSLGAAAATAADTATDRAIASYERRLQQRPVDPWTHYRLGDAYLQKFRVTSDPTWLGLAEQALRQSLALAPEQASARRHLAYALYMRHEFEAAAREATHASVSAGRPSASPRASARSRAAIAPSPSPRRLERAAARAWA